YNPDIFRPGTIRGWIEDYKGLLESLIADPQPPLSKWLNATAVSPDDAAPARSADAHLFERSNLTKCQFLIWMGKKLEPDAPQLMNEINAELIFIPSHIERAHLQKAFQTLINASDALRTVIEEVDGAPRQRVVEDFPYEIPFVDLSNDADPVSKARAWACRQSQAPFDFTRRMFELVLIKLRNNEFALYLNIHHLIADARSAELVIQYLADFYARSLAGELDEPIVLPRFADYIDFERRARGSASYRKAEEYWKKKVEQEPEPINFYGNAQAEDSTQVGRMSFRLDPERARKLQAVAMQIGGASANLGFSSTFVGLLCAFLYQTSRSRDISLGVPFHNRRMQAFDKTI